MAMAELTAPALTELINHVFLPPQLPQQSDSGSFSELMKISLSALHAFSTASTAYAATIGDAISLLTISLAIHHLSEDNISEGRLRDSLRACHPCFLFLRAQNAGILITYNDHDDVFVEQFELSPRNEAVMTTEGRLVRTFPGSAVCISSATREDIGFQDTFADTLSLMCHQAVGEMQPHVTKTGQANAELRDTTHPGLISELFVGGFLKGAGKPISLSSILKHTRDDVLLKDAKLPWRRSAAWMLIKVSLELTLSRSTGGSAALYKQFMVFLMAHVLQHAVAAGLPGETLFVMNAKVAGRLGKLKHDIASPLATDPILDYIRQEMKTASEVGPRQWTAIQKRNTRSIPISRTLSKPEPEHDILHILPVLDDYIQKLRNRPLVSGIAGFAGTPKLVNYDPTSLPSLAPQTNDSDYALANLQQFEMWISLNLEHWSRLNGAQQNACSRLRHVLEEYHTVARRSYKDNPEAMSFMLLTLLEIWVACDQVAIRICALLRQYSPGIPQDAFQNLILPSKAQMERLRAVELLLANRTTNSVFPATELFALSSPSGFAVKYFEQSPAQQDTMRQISAKAKRDRERKLMNFASLKADYARLMNLYSTSACDFVDVVIDDWEGLYETESKHSSSCAKCAYLEQAKGLEITIFEEPLPSNDIKAKAIVFELEVPTWFSGWRDARTFLLRTVLQGKYAGSKPRAQYPLHKDSHLSAFKTLKHSPRITLLSQDKPNIVAHYRTKRVGTSTDSDVCKKSGVNYEYYDTKDGVFLGELLYDRSSQLECVYNLPKSLRSFIFRPSALPDGPSPNLVIANQDQCPDNMTLDEFKELCTIPLGHKIQWQNMLLQLKSPSVDFKKPETTLVFLQCLYQTGPSNKTIVRANHEILLEYTFAVALLEALDTALQRVKENWESSQALSIFVAIAARVLSLSESTSIQRGCIAFLSTAREVALGWVALLRDKTFVDRSVEVALICAMTFDIDTVHLTKLLESSGNVSSLVQLSITVREGRLASSPEPFFRLLQSRFSRLLHRANTTLAANTSAHNGVDLAIQSSWSAYRSGMAWTTVSPKLDYWLVTKTAATSNSESLTVHFNTITGELLVNGLPMDRPPKQYEDATLYRTLFGQAAVEVMPSAVRGMRYSTKELFHGRSVNLGMSDGGDLLVQTSSVAETCEIIPARLLKDDFPAFFTDKFIHVYDSSEHSTSDVVEFRPVGTPWSSGTSGVWHLRRCNDSSRWKLTRRDGDALISLISLKSETAKAIAKVLQPLARSSQIHNILPASRATKEARMPMPMDMDIEIPDLRLGFSLDRKDYTLRSHQYREMKIDIDQSLGTLVGFENKLMLRTRSKDQAVRRMVILLESSPVSYIRDESSAPHTTVSIKRTARDVRVHAFDVDAQLGRLTGSGSLDSKLFLALLHAITTSYLPDPLTKKTGTEQALADLDSAATRSFDTLTEHNISLLAQIASLTPGRSYYPQNKRVMQQVEWDSRLGVLAQHGGFYKTVTSIFEQAKRFGVFDPDSKPKFPSLSRTDRDILNRDSARSSSFRVSEFGAEDHTVVKDVSYKARDGGHTHRSDTAFLASSFIFDDRRRLQWGMDDGDHLWDLMPRTGTVFGDPVNLTELKYDSKVLTTWRDYVVGHWPGIHEAMKNLQDSFSQKFNVMMWLSTLGYSRDIDLQVLQTLAACFNCELVQNVAAPLSLVFYPSRGKEIDCNQLRGVLNQYTVPYRRTILRESGEKFRTWQARDATEKRKHQENVVRAINRVVNSLLGQGCPAVPFAPVISTLPFIAAFVNVDNAMDDVRKLFKIWSDNFELHSYLCKVEAAVRLYPKREKTVPAALPLIPSAYSRSDGYISIQRLFSVATAPSILAESPIFDSPPNHLELAQSTQRKSPLLEKLISKLGHSTGDSRYMIGYVEDLTKSLGSLRSREDGNIQAQHLTEQDLIDHVRNCLRHVTAIFDAMASALKEGNEDSVLANQFPRLSPMLLLSQLSHGKWSQLNSGWRAAIVKYGVAITSLQRAERMLQALRKGGTDSADLMDELQNPGHGNWDPLIYPESLLVEVESGIMIRDVQESIAAKMRSPENGDNTTMQLNMGQGKSSVIVPIVACALADGSQLVRVIVAKPQSKQMAEMLKSKLGAAVGRRVYYMPFSRSLKLDRAAADTVLEICQECMRTGGILLVQPEHILSSKLMALESFNRGKEEVGRSLIRTQDFFDSSARDIVDESDENFNVKFELIYTMGAQRPVEGSPDRWTHILQVLELVKIKAPAVLALLGSSSIEIHDGAAGAFPRIRILKPNAEQLLLHLVARHICDFGLDGFPLGRQTKKVQDELYIYMSQMDLTGEQSDAVQDAGSTGFWTDSTKGTILLLRGLLGGGVLAFVFGQKRFRVNFGASNSRIPPTKLAVPYRAKDSPTPRSEFSHPDVVIILTCLCYYYGGLSDEELFTSLAHVMDSDQADSEYQAWVADADQLDPAFAQLQGINLKDRKQCIARLFPSLKLGKTVVDYYLSRIVFPKELKEFPFKYSSSGWDLGKKKAKPITGFSGTSDSRIVLPLSVTHLDLEEQNHTNALVLEYLLRKENTVKHIPSLFQSAQSDAQIILSATLQLENSPEVILDVGAQILELDNLQVAKKWLEMRRTFDNSKEAVVFVNGDDELSVVDCKGRVELLQTSSFASRLGACLIFLDEAHTRGIDLKLPSLYSAAVTLGANLTKDRLVQACMRLRKLGQGQSVVFLVSEEIRAKIQDCTAKSDRDPIEVLDVLLWAISETFAEMHRSIPQWSVQGERFLQQEELSIKCRWNGKTNYSFERSEWFLAPEAQSREDRYRPRLEHRDSADRLAHSTNPMLRKIAEHCGMFKYLRFNASTLQEEQERELSPEIEQERQIQKTAPAKPEQHTLEPDVIRFAREGVLLSGSKAYFPAFDTLRETSGAQSFKVTSFAGNLMVTADFARTVVKPGKSYRSDQYQRSVQWIISRKYGKVDTLMIISPYEANQLVSEIASSTKTALHLYKPRCNSGFPTLDRLDLYTVTGGQQSAPTIPRALAIELGLFAGQLYISSFEDYQRICNFLGLTDGATPPGWNVTPDGFIMWDGKKKRRRSENPVQFIKFLMSSVRRNGQGISKTHMGGLLEGRVFQRSDFEDEQ